MTKDMDAETLAALKELLAMVEEGGHWHFDKCPPPDFLPECWVDAFNGSLDAANALMEAALPGWVAAQIAQTDRMEASMAWLVELRKGFVTSFDKGIGAHAATPARAWLITIIKALIWEAEQ